MAEELSYVLITPHTLKKSRTGGIIARLLSRTDLDIVAARVFAPTAEFMEKYAALIEDDLKAVDQKSSQLLASYVRQNFAPHAGKHNRIMMLLFRGEDACAKIQSIVGNLKAESKTGETIRDTYADHVLNHDGSVRYFEPAVLCSTSHAEREFRLFAEFAKSEPNIVEKPLIGSDDCVDKTLVILKPDNWRYPSSRPGNIIDMLSRTGLRIIGTKIYQMSVAEALEFYGPVKDVLREKLSPRIGLKAREILEGELKIKLPEESVPELTKVVGVKYADDQFSQIVEFMAGVRPEDCAKADLGAPGKVKCMVLIYQGPNAVEKIRNVLGPTDPTKAPGGTVRRDFGTDVMVNTAHASDSLDNAKREMGIIKIGNNGFVSVVEEYLKNKGG